MAAVYELHDIKFVYCILHNNISTVFKFLRTNFNNFSGPSREKDALGQGGLLFTGAWCADWLFDAGTVGGAAEAAACWGHPEEGLQEHASQHSIPPPAYL